MVENIELTRAPQPSLDGVYFITPSEKSVRALIADCDARVHRKAHVFFTSPASQGVLRLIKSSPTCVSMLGNCSELNLEYVAVDQHGFSVMMDGALRETFGAGCEASQAQARALDMISARLATVLVSLGEIPAIRYMAKVGHRTSDVSRGVADRLDRIVTGLLRAKGAEAAKNSPTCDVLIVDRSVDVIAPVIHEWTYESMVHDLLDVKNGVYRYKITTNAGEQEKDAVLGDDDSLWTELRHAHIAEVLTTLADKTRAFAHIGPQGTGTRDLTTGQLKRAVEALPRVLEQRAKLSVHASIASEINALLQSCALSEVGRLEQDVVYGDATSKDIAYLFNTLDEKGIRLPMVEKLRLLLCYVASHPQKIDAAEKSRWCKQTGLTASDVDILEKLELLGVKVLKDKASQSYFSSSTKASRPKVLERTGEGSDWDLYKFLPTIAGLIADIDSGALDGTEYPSIGSESRSNVAATAASAAMLSPTKAKSVRTRTEASWATRTSSAESIGGESDTTDSSAAAAASRHHRADSSASNRASKRASRRLIVFIVGGMTRGELREAHALSKTLHREVLIGSTSLETPASFVEKLASLSTTVGRQYERVDLSGL